MNEKRKAITRIIAYVIIIAFLATSLGALATLFNN